jgi:hypothetical protein
MTIKRLNHRGQTLIEFAVVLPFLLMLVLAIIEIGYALLDQHVVTKLSREGSNLISRNTTLDDALTAMKGMSTRPVNLDNGSRVIFSVLKKVSTAGAPNFDKEVLYQRYEYGTLAATSTLKTKGSGSFSGPDHQAPNSDSNTSLQLTNLPPGMMATGGMLYVTEIFTTHVLITPLDKWGITVPQTLYSIAYF